MRVESSVELSVLVFRLSVPLESHSSTVSPDCSPVSTTFTARETGSTRPALVPSRMRTEESPHEVSSSSVPVQAGCTRTSSPCTISMPSTARGMSPLTLSRFSSLGHQCTTPKSAARVARMTVVTIVARAAVLTRGAGAVRTRPC